MSSKRSRASTPGWKPGSLSVKRRTKSRSGAGRSPSKGNSGAERVRGPSARPCDCGRTYKHGHCPECGSVFHTADSCDMLG